LCSSLQLPQSTVSRHLRVLSDEGWVAARGEGTSRYYKGAFDEMESGARDLWMIVREQLGNSLGVAADLRRAEAMIAKRKAKVRLFFDSAAENWDALRAELIGDRNDVLALLDLLDENWVIGDLGCGTGHISATLSASVEKVIAVDESGPMLATARERLASATNVELREGHIEALPIEDATLDAAVLFLVAHFITDPARAMQEIRRVLKPKGKLMIVDLMPHDRDDLVSQFGHVWQGFDESQIRGWLENAGFSHTRYRPMAPDASDRTPRLVAATARNAW
jgi:ArsR family transcriptional regulator